MTTRGTVIGYAGDDLVVEFRDEDRDETATATLHVWELRAGRAQS